MTSAPPIRHQNWFRIDSASIVRCARDDPITVARRPVARVDIQHVLAKEAHQQRHRYYSQDEDQAHGERAHHGMQQHAEAEPQKIEWVQHPRRDQRRHQEGEPPPRTPINAASRPKGRLRQLWGSAPAPLRACALHHSSCVTLLVRRELRASSESYGHFSRPARTANARRTDRSSCRQLSKRSFEAQPANGRTDDELDTHGAVSGRSCGRTRGCEFGDVCGGADARSWGACNIFGRDCRCDPGAGGCRRSQARGRAQTCRAQARHRALTLLKRHSAT